MRFENIHVGGAELDLAQIVYLGDVGLAQEYIYPGRKLLGELKLRVQQKQITQGAELAPNGIARQTLRNKVKLTATTIFGDGQVTHDVDVIFIDVRDLVTNKYRVIGYIVQGFSEGEIGDDLYLKYFDFQTITPSGKILGYADIDETTIGKRDLFEQISNNVNGFPDDGTKHIDFVDWNNHSIPSSSMYQSVYVLIWNRRITFTGKPGVSAMTPFPDPGLPALNTDWSWVSSYSHSEGVCGTLSGHDDIWNYTVNPCVYTLFEKTYTLNSDRTGFITQDVELSSLNSNLPYYSGGWHDSMIGCQMDNPDSGATDADWINHLIAETKGPAAAALDASIANFYGVALGLSKYDTLEDSWYTNMSYPPPVDIGQNEEFKLIRRSDGHGFMSDSGLSLQNGITFTTRTNENGKGAAFMLSQGSEAILKYADEIFAYKQNPAQQPNEITYQNTPEGTGGTAGYQVKDSNKPCDSVYILGGEGSIGVEVTKTTRDTTTALQAFGIPCKCESGVHSVIVKKPTNDSTNINLRVYLKVQDFGFVSVDIRNATGFNDKNVWTSQIKINIKDVDTLDQVTDLVTVSPYVPRGF